MISRLPSRGLHLRACAALILILAAEVSCTPTESYPGQGSTSERTGASLPQLNSTSPQWPDACTIVSPDQTQRDLQASLEAAGSDGDICFEKGIYRLESSLAPLPGQTLLFRSGAVLNGSTVVTNWTRQGNYWISTEHHQSFSSNVTGLPDDAMCTQNPGACLFEDVYFDGRPLLHVATLADLDEPDKVFFDKTTATIYIAADPTNKLVEATIAEMAIGSSANNVTISGATIEKFAYNGVSTAADDWTIEDSEIRDVHFQGIGVYGGTGHVIQDNHVHMCGMLGMTAVDVNDMTIQRNEFDHNNYLNAGPETGGYHEGAVKILKSRGVVFRGNWSHNNDGDGLWFDYDNYGILIENNVLENNTRNGLQYEASFDATVRYNTIRNNGTDWDSQGAGIYNSTSKNVEYYGNRLEDNVIRSIVITWHDRGSSDTFGERQSSNLYFHDNVIVLDDNFQSWVGIYWDQDPRVYSANNRFQGNTYYVPAENRSWWLWDTELNWAQWRAEGFDTTGSLHLS
jgi:Right handed beta helix region